MNLPSFLRWLEENLVYILAAPVVLFFCAVVWVGMYRLLTAFGV